MVTTNSTSPDLTFVTDDLRKSDHPEDNDLAKTTAEQIVRLVATIKPVLRYVDREQYGHRVVEVAKDQGRVLLLSRDGVWGYVAGSEFHQSESEWELWKFSAVFAGLQEVLNEALAKKREHTEAITKRTNLLSAINDLIENATK